MEFENGNSISCLDYGVFDSEQACCGDGQCNNGEDTGSCYADCYVPDPPGPQTAVLVNGSFNPTPPDWISYGSAEFNAIWSTYGVEPVTHFWEENDLGNVTGSYEGIYAGAGPLASRINALPAGEVNIVAHSHGGNVAMLSTSMLNRNISHLIELATPVNYDFDRTVYGVGERCIASSWSDEVQFLGASPYQIGNYTVAEVLFHAFDQLAEDAWLNQDWEAYAVFQGLALGALYDMSYWWSTTKEEFWSWVIPFNGFGHSDMHEPTVWSYIPGFCKNQ
jgi:hypothetical protein